MIARVTEEHGRRLVIARSLDLCEGCGRAKAGTHAHRVRRSQGGTWCPTNGLRLCGSGTAGCHGWSGHNPDAAKDLGWELRPHQDPAAEPALIYATGLWRAWWLLEPDGGYRWVRNYDAADLELAS